MKKNLLLIVGLSIVSLLTAQELSLSAVVDNSDVADGSLLIEMTISGIVEEINSKEAIQLTPYISTASDRVDMPKVLLNGKYRHIVYKRTSKKNNSENAPYKVLEVAESQKFTVLYKVAIPAAEWMKNGVDLQIKYEGINADDETSPLSTLYVDNIKYPATTVSYHTAASIATPAPAVATTPKAVIGYKGAYVAPESDAMEKRNKENLYFSIEEAQVMANMNPEILSLKELYDVAMSYKDDKDKFYQLIATSVKLYPTLPIANLNAASMAIELGDAEAAAKYLQMSPYDTLAYKNCRGVYELMCGNIYEGMRLLKSAKTEGSEEAGYNLEFFFKSNK